MPDSQAEREAAWTTVFRARSNVAELRYTFDNAWDAARAAGRGEAAERIEALEGALRGLRHDGPLTADGAGHWGDCNAFTKRPCTPACKAAARALLSEGAE